MVVLFNFIITLFVWAFPSYSNAFLNLYPFRLKENPQASFIHHSIIKGKSSTIHHQRQSTFLLSTHSSNIPNSSLNTNDSQSVAVDISIEYCTGCRWLLRSTWITQELFTTFEKEMTSITLIPNKPLPPSKGGVFQMKLLNHKEEEEVEENQREPGDVLLWDRKVQGGFPESKQIKQMIRNIIAPDKSLGHSDGTIKSTTATYPASIPPSTKQQEDKDCVECNQNHPIEKEEEKKKEVSSTSSSSSNKSTPPTPNISIQYSNSKYMFRSTWLAQELLSSMQDRIGSVTLIPTRKGSNKDDDDDDNMVRFDILRVVVITMY